MKTKLFTIAMMVAFIMTAMTKVQAQNFEGPCLPSMHGLNGHQSAFCGSILTQTIALSAGVNWFSTYVEITLDDLKAAMVEALPGANNIVIQSKSQNTTYNGTRWRGQLNTLDVASMYKITVEDNCQISLTGMPINPAEHPITIAGNAVTWIGFPFATNMTIEDAFAGFAVSGDQVSAKGQNTTYNGTRWRGQLNTLEPGKGYIYNSAATGNRTFTFPTSAK